MNLLKHCEHHEQQQQSYVCMYRVFNKEGHKVLGCKTNKKFDFEAIKKLKASKNMGHFDNQSSLP